MVTLNYDPQKAKAAYSPYSLAKRLPTRGEAPSGFYGTRSRAVRMKRRAYGRRQEKSGDGALMWHQAITTRMSSIPNSHGFRICLSLRQRRKQSLQFGRFWKEFFLTSAGLGVLEVNGKRLRNTYFVKSKRNR